MAKFVDAQRDADDLAKLVNEDIEVTTRYGDNPKRSWKFLEGEFDALLAGFSVQGDAAIDAINADVVTVDNARIAAESSIYSDASAVDAYRLSAQSAIASDVETVDNAKDTALTSINNNKAVVQQAADSVDVLIDELTSNYNLTPAFDFADGFTIQTRNQAGKDADGNYWVYSGALPFVVTAGTVPSSPNYKQVTFNSSDNISTVDGNLTGSLKIRATDDALFGDRFVGYFADGFVYTSDSDVAKGSDGNYYKYAGVSAYPVVVAAGTDEGNSAYSAVAVKDEYFYGLNIKNLNIDTTGLTDESDSFSKAIDEAVEYYGGVLNVSGDIKIDLVKNVSGLHIKGNARFIGGASTCLTLNGDNNTVEGIDVEDTNRNTATLWLNGNGNTAINVKAYNQVKSTSPTALFGDLIRVSGNDNQVLFCEGYNGYTGLKIDGGNTPSERVSGIKVWGCKLHDNIRGGTIKPEVGGATIQSNEFNDNDVNEDQGSDGLLCERNVKDIDLQFNQFHRNGEHGLYLQGSGCNVSNNYANDNFGSGLKFGGKKGENFNDSNGLLTDVEYNAQYISEDCIISKNHCYRNGLGNTNAGIYLQETHKGYTVSGNYTKYNQYGIRSVNQQLGGEIENLKLINNICTDNITRDASIAVTDRAVVKGGDYGTFETFMPDRVFQYIKIQAANIGTLSSASVQDIELIDTHINTDWNTSSAASIRVKGGSFHSTSDINLSKFKYIIGADIYLDGDYTITSSVKCNIYKISNVNIYAPSTTGNVYNISTANAPDNTTFSNIEIFENSGVRAMDIYGNGHTVNGVKSNTVSGQDVVHIRGDDCSVSQCSSRVSTNARVTASGNNNIITTNQLTVIDSGTGNIRFANRLEP